MYILGQETVDSQEEAFMADWNTYWRTRWNCLNCWPRCSRHYLWSSGICWPKDLSTFLGLQQISTASADCCWSNWIVSRESSVGSFSGWCWSPDHVSLCLWSCSAKFVPEWWMRWLQRVYNTGEFR